MPRRTTLNTAQLLSQLGVRGGELGNDLADGPIIPTVQIASVSSLAQERVEARGVISVVYQSTGPLPVLQLMITSPGGILIEDFEIAFVGGGSTNIVPRPDFPLGAHLGLAGDRVTGGYVIGGGEDGFAPPDLRELAQVGGIPATTEVVTGQRGLDPVFGGAPILPPVFRMQPGARWWYPAGTELSFTTNVHGENNPENNPTVQVNATIRELPASGSV